MTISIQYKGSYKLIINPELSAPYEFVSGNIIVLKKDTDLPFFERQPNLFRILKAVSKSQEKRFASQASARRTGFSSSSLPKLEEKKNIQVAKKEEIKVVPKTVDKKEETKVVSEVVDKKEDVIFVEQPNIKKNQNILTQNIKNKTVNK
ncbi:MAG: hypothetical protein KKD01_19575 [Proteobacteria bacterium]|nr:hypothetical protein [Pseudomonadota bacterium]